LGCGSLRSVRNYETKTDTKINEFSTSNFDEYENLYAEIPISLLKTLELPGGITIIAKDDTSITGAKNDSLQTVKISYTKSSSSKDSTIKKEETKIQEEVKKDTSVETSNWAVWIIVGIAATIGIIILAKIYLRF